MRKYIVSVQPLVSVDYKKFLGFFSDFNLMISITPVEFAVGAASAYGDEQVIRICKWLLGDVQLVVDRIF